MGNGFETAGEVRTVKIGPIIMIHFVINHIKVTKVLLKSERVTIVNWLKTLVLSVFLVLLQTMLFDLLWQFIKTHLSKTSTSL